MAKYKSYSKKRRLIKADKRATPAPIWAEYRVHGKRAHLWRLNRKERRNWRTSKLKV